VVVRNQYQITRRHVTIPETVPTQTRKSKEEQTKEKLHSPIGLGGDQLHWRQSLGEQNSPGSTRREQKTSITRRARRKKHQGGGRRDASLLLHCKIKVSPPLEKTSREQREKLLPQIGISR
jgi:hypothetical protein